ncbi:hypothetical protein [Marininema halotolerans]|uniref:ACT domain-containing protein n=1 Tax=Marininema halotolerans TaxID=1155944 RepID=A0A1I6QMH7_9BACL|nr:hypothetical protein [Marininema halotolerans]SFS53633.1 hypothetical protein SAMN05444972_103248 [Marininema halotolerans]
MASKNHPIQLSGGNASGFFVRTQFNFSATPRTYACFLSGLADRNVSITGILETVIGRRRRVRVVVSQPNVERRRDLVKTRNVLKNLGIPFRETKVIQARVINIPTGVPGVIRSFNNALYCKMRISNTYIGENSYIYIDVANRNIPQALRILRMMSPPQCPTNCP